MAEAVHLGSIARVMDGIDCENERDGDDRATDEEDWSRGEGTDVRDISRTCQQL